MQQWSQPSTSKVSRKLSKGISQSRGQPKPPGKVAPEGSAPIQPQVLSHSSRQEPPNTQSPLRSLQQHVRVPGTQTAWENLTLSAQHQSAFTAHGSFTQIYFFTWSSGTPLVRLYGDGW